MTDEDAAAPDAIPLTREFTVDAGYAGRAAWALVRRVTLRRPATWSVVAIALVAVALALLGVDVMWLVALVLIVMAALTPLLVFVSTRRLFRRRFPDGTVMRTGFGATRFTNEAPQFSSTVDYSMYYEPTRDGEFVFLRLAATRAPVLFPGTLFGDDDLARFSRTNPSPQQLS